MEEKFLPIGTVVKLKDATAEAYLMITGFCVNKEEDETVIYDYLGCMYPQGMIDQNANFLFNHDNIEKILYKGFVNDYEVEFKKELKKFMADNGIVVGTTVAQSSNVEQSVEIPMMQQGASMVDLTDVSQMVETLDINQDN